MHLDIAKTATAWTSLAATVFVPHSNEEYTQLVAVLDQLIDQIGEDESHPLASLMEMLGVLIEHSENAHMPELMACLEEKCKGTVDRESDPYDADDAETDDLQQ